MYDYIKFQNLILKKTLTFASTDTSIDEFEN